MFESEIQPTVLQGLKPNIDLIGFIGTTKVMPCYKALEIELWVSFSATCLAPGWLRADSQARCPTGFPASATIPKG